MSRARITFGSIIDMNQPASIKIIETGGKLQLCIILGINAKKASDTEPGDGDTERDVFINNEIFLTGRAKLGLRKKSSTTGTSVFSVTFDGDLDTKVPGTGEKFLELDTDPFPFENDLEHSKS